MKKLFALLALAFSTIAHAQLSDNRMTGTLTATCSNATTSCSGTPGSTVETGVSGYGLATVSVNGTYAGSTINFEFSDDGGINWYQNTCTRSDLSLQEQSEVLPSNQSRAWDCGVAAGSRLRVRQSANSSGSINVGITLSQASIEPAPTVGLTQTAATPFFNAALTTAATVKSSQGILYGYSIYNPNATTCFLQVFNAASGNVTLGTTTPILSIGIPNGPAMANISPGAIGLSNFSTAIAVAATTTATGSTTCGTGMTVNLFYL